MSIINSSTLLASGTDGYQISRSLRFNRADSAYLSRSFSVAGNRRTWTWSGWVKRSTGNADQVLFGNNELNNFSAIRFRSSEKLEFAIGEGSNVIASTAAVFRDYSAWYHIVCVSDTTNATSGDRMIVYVNNVRQTLSSVSNYPPSQNYDGGFNRAITHAIGNNTNYGDAFGGYLTETYFIDGQALTPSSFGETDTITGVWKPKKYTGTYGTNGFYLNFSDNSGTTSTTLGKDSSGNGNNWTPNNFSVTAGAGNDVLSDTPTTNWCTLNAADPIISSLSQGNLKTSGPGNNWGHSRSTFAMSSGKWYWEDTPTWSGGNYTHTGVVKAEAAFNNNVGQNSYSWGFNTADGKIYNNNSGTSYGSGVSSGTVLGFAFDADTGKMWVRNASGYYNSGDPAAGTNPGMTAGAGTYFAAGSGYQTDSQDEFNFGQRSFSYTPPTGYKALNTANLPEPTIKKGGKYFDAKLVTTTGSSQNVTGLNFQPDLVWQKSRNDTYSHILEDAVRGAGKRLSSDQTVAEDSLGVITSFNTDGFTSNYSGWGTAPKNWVAWCWDAGGTGSTNTAGSRTSTVSANASAGFSIVTYTGNSTAGATVGHGLGVAPSMIITKARGASSEWGVYHSALGGTKALLLNQAYDQQTNVLYWNNTNPSSTVFTLGGGSTTNNTTTYVAYCFSEVAGYSKFGSYTGNGSSDGPFVFCGFRPAWVMIKNTNLSGGNWRLIDTTRETYNVGWMDLYANDSTGETAHSAGTTNQIDILSNGFKLRDQYNETNRNGDTLIFAAFAELPFKYSTAR